MKVHVQLQGRTETLHEGDGATRQLTKPASTKPSALPRKQHAQTRLQCGRDEVRATAQCQSDRDRKREHPLSIRHARQHVVEEMGGRILGAASGARRTDAAALARKRHKHLVTTRAAPHASKTAGENAAVDEAIELALHQPRHLMAAASDGSGEGRAVMADGPMKRGVFDVTGPVARRQRGARLGPAPVPIVAARQWRQRGKVHPDTAVSIGRSVQAASTTSFARVCPNA
jgi:hypothetical protein